MSYDEDLRRAYLGEWFGDGLLSALAEHACWPPAQRGIAAELAALERITAAVLSAAAGPLCTAQACTAAYQNGRDAHAKYRDADWISWMADLHHGLPDVVARYANLYRAAPPAHRDAAAFLYLHERALADFASKEAAGSTDGMAEIRALLRATPAERALAARQAVATL